jgi:hypothetical protein
VSDLQIEYSLLSRGLLSGHWSTDRELPPADVRAHQPRFSGENLERNRLESIVAAGVADRAFVADAPRASARASFDATARFHNPVNAPAWSRPGIDAEYEAVGSIVLAGLAARPGPSR